MEISEICTLHSGFFNLRRSGDSLKVWVNGILPILELKQLMKAAILFYRQKTPKLNFGKLS